MHPTVRRALLWSVAVLALVGVLAVLSAVREPSRSAPGASAPRLSGTGLDGATHDLADIRGTVVLVNFWASWCAPCREETEVLVLAGERYADDGLAVIGVNSQDRPRYARRAAAAWGADAYPNLLDEDGRLAVAWGVVGLPETFVLGPDRTIVERHKGAVTEQWIDDTVVPLLAEAGAS